MNVIGKSVYGNRLLLFLLFGLFESLSQLSAVDAARLPEIVVRVEEFLFHWSCKLNCAVFLDRATVVLLTSQCQLFQLDSFKTFIELFGGFGSLQNLFTVNEPPEKLLDRILRIDLLKVKRKQSLR